MKTRTFSQSNTIKSDVPSPGGIGPFWGGATEGLGNLRDKRAVLGDNAGRRPLGIGRAHPPLVRFAKIECRQSFSTTFPKIGLKSSAGPVPTHVPSRGAIQTTPEKLIPVLIHHVVKDDQCGALRSAISDDLPRMRLQARDQAIPVPRSGADQGLSQNSSRPSPDCDCFLIHNIASGNSDVRSGRFPLVAFGRRILQFGQCHRMWMRRPGSSIRALARLP